MIRKQQPGLNSSLLSLFGHEVNEKLQSGNGTATDPQECADQHGVDSKFLHQVFHSINTMDLKANVQISLLCPEYVKVEIVKIWDTEQEWHQYMGNSIKYDNLCTMVQQKNGMTAKYYTITERFESLQSEMGSLSKNKWKVSSMNVGPL